VKANTIKQINDGFRQESRSLGKKASYTTEFEMYCVVTPAVVRQLDLSTFVQRSGSRLILGNSTFKFTGATNYYMLTRAADKETRHQASALHTCIQIFPVCSVVYILIENVRA